MGYEVRRTAGGTNDTRSVGRRLVAGVAAVTLLGSGMMACERPEPTERLSPASPASAMVTPTARPSGTQAVCANAEAVWKSLNSLLSRDFTGINGAEAAVKRLQADLRRLRASASGEVRQQAAALSASVADLGSAVRRVRDGESPTEIWPQVRSAVDEVETNAANLRESLNSICPQR
ncbi:hypothetical protein ABN034_15025 [Actinopolymorpha sp. B11F2]|uniref:hypothetical protein n=1 Tax=Actinopolymorpha sp. B11F2 TaxID=3160862 RepID=UPI0032E4B368